MRIKGSISSSVINLNNIAITLPIVFGHGIHHSSYSSTNKYGVWPAMLQFWNNDMAPFYHLIH
ncbi:hypothetical protein BH20ACI2_BH20ACI2_01640 [soil metagenome]